MTGLTETPQPSGRQKPLAEWIAELGEGPVSWGRAADELIAGRYRSWWFNHVTGGRVGRRNCTCGLSQNGA